MTAALDSELRKIEADVKDKMDKIAVSDRKVQPGILGTCRQCKKMILRGQGCKAMGDLWHTGCFCCTTCSQGLYTGDGSTEFYQMSGKPYCKQHYKELLGKKCSACSQIIVDRIISFGGKDYHVDCFVCANPKCQDNKLDGRAFIPNEGSLYCRECYREMFGIVCDRCEKSIVMDGQVGDVPYTQADGKNFHNECYCCAECNGSFDAGERPGAYPINNQLLCYNCAINAV